MDIVTAATEWAKAEVFSSRFFIFFAVLFLLASIGFWQLGKTDTSKTFIYPTLIAGILLMAVGVGILFTNQSRVKSFESAYHENANEFIKSEILRTKKSMGEFKTIVFKIIPIIVAVAAILIVLFEKPIIRAICITTIAMMVVILFVDINANARITDYHSQLEKAAE